MQYWHARWLESIASCVIPLSKQSHAGRYRSHLMYVGNTDTQMSKVHSYYGSFAIYSRGRFRGVSGVSRNPLEIVLIPEKYCSP